MENQKNILRIINKILKKKVKINQNEMNNVNIFDHLDSLDIMRLIIELEVFFKKKINIAKITSLNKLTISNLSKIINNE